MGKGSEDRGEVMSGVKAMKNALKQLEDLNCVVMTGCKDLGTEDENSCSTLGEFEECCILNAMVILRRAIKYYEKSEVKE